MVWIGIAQDITADGLIPTASDSGQKPSMAAPPAPSPPSSPATNRTGRAAWAATPFWRRVQIGVSLVVFAVVGMILLSSRDRIRPGVGVRPHPAVDGSRRQAPEYGDRWLLPNEVPPATKAKPARSPKPAAPRAPRDPEGARAAQPSITSRPEAPGPGDTRPSGDEAAPTLDRVRALERSF